MSGDIITRDMCFLLDTKWNSALPALDRDAVGPRRTAVSDRERALKGQEPIAERLPGPYPKLSKVKEREKRQPSTEIPGHAIGP